MSLFPTPENDEPLMPGGEALPPGALRVPEARSAFREALERSTVAVVRRSAARRRMARAGQFALAYAAGVLTAIALWRAAENGAPRHGELVQRAQVLPSAPSEPRQTVGPRQPQTAAIDERRLSPAQLRARVEGAPRAEQIRLLRLAGDRYLYDYDDINSALHCYRQVLELEPPDRERPFGPEDSWLLAELKNARVLQQGGQRPPGA
jgi:hypothetical protein